MGFKSLESDMAFVTILPNLKGVDLTFWDNNCVEEMWHELVSFAHDAPLTSLLKTATLEFVTSREEDLKGLAIAMCILVLAVAISISQSKTYNSHKNHNKIIINLKKKHINTLLLLHIYHFQLSIFTIKRITLFIEKMKWIHLFKLT